MSKPLESFRVLDLTNVLAGPFCCHQLAHMGAEVIKVEAVGRGDLARQLGADLELSNKNMGVSFLAQNAGKKSVTVNLKHPEGKARASALSNHPPLAWGSARQVMHAAICDEHRKHDPRREESKGDSDGAGGEHEIASQKHRHRNEQHDSTKAQKREVSEDLDIATSSAHPCVDAALSVSHEDGGRTDGDAKRYEQRQ